MTETGFRRLLRRKARESSYRQLGAELGVSGQYIFRVVNGDRPASKSLAEKLGYRKIVTARYERIGEGGA